MQTGGFRQLGEPGVLLGPSATATWKNWQRVRTAFAFQGLSPGCLAGSEGSRAFGPQLGVTLSCALGDRQHRLSLIPGAQVLAALTTKVYVAR